MSVLVDEAIWPWRGDRWAHLVSDTSYAELHAFAAELGLRRMAFQGDHYDVPAAVRAAALDLGARPVPGRELVRRLRTSGLRLAAADRPGRWESMAITRGLDGRPVLADQAPVSLSDAVATVAVDWVTAVVEAFERSGEVAVVVECAGGVGVVDDGRVEARRTDGDRRLELLARW